jgi:hypothetical protein
MEKIILILSFFLTSSFIAQSKSLEYPLEKNGDKSFTYLYFKKIISELQIDSIENNKNEFYFRYISLRHITEVWKNRKGEVQGKNICFLEKETKEKNKQKEYLIKTTSIDSKKLNKIYKEIVKSKIDTIDSKMNLVNDNKKKNLILMEFSQKNSYKFKEFWVHTNSEYQNYYEKKIVELDKLLKKEIDYNKIYQDIISNLPKGCYNLANGFVKCNN